MPEYSDGPSTTLFQPLLFKGGIRLRDIARAGGVSTQMAEAANAAPEGRCCCWGMPFTVRRVLVLNNEPITIDIKPVRTRWLVFMHTSDVREDPCSMGTARAGNSGPGHLGEHAADYVIVYSDGSEERIAIRRRYEIGAMQRPWGENCVGAVVHRKPWPIPAHQEQSMPAWGWSQCRVTAPEGCRWLNWLFAWENRRPHSPIKAIRLEPVSGTVVVLAISHGRVSSSPIRWNSRRTAVLRLPEATKFDRTIDKQGRLSQIRLDMGQVISAVPRPIYPDSTWNDTPAGKLPEISEHEVIVDYTAHENARFHLAGSTTIPVAGLKPDRGVIRAVSPADRRVRVRIIDKRSRKPVAVRLHIHNAIGQYCPPLDHHRIPNLSWFEDYGAELAYRNVHISAYVRGETMVRLPVGSIFVEIYRGCEIRPIRTTVKVGRATEELVFEIEKVLPWREKGWVSADTHVHFLSPSTGLMEGEAEGVNIVNLLASQWGELMTNAGDFDGATTWGSKEAGGSGEWLLRVGTENRQHVMGHISLLGYEGPMIMPMTVGGPDESAIGDTVESLLLEWARRCRKQNGVVVIPHFPNPRLEHAAAIVEGAADAVEMTSGTGGISPYSLSDWYRYLNCGCLVAAVGGTDKMQAAVPVGANRTYTRIRDGEEFTYETWKEAVRRAETFVTCGPLMEFSAEGHPMGSRVKTGRRGLTINVSWEAASVTMPMTSVELVVNGEIRETVKAGAWKGEGHFTVKIERSTWIALMIRGVNAGGAEIIAAHSSPVMFEVEGSPFYAAADAETILEQIEGALAYLDTVGTKADTRAYRRMRLALTTAYRNFHDRMHRAGRFHGHSALTDHAVHHNSPHRLHRA